jgi:hypothetical protein
MKKLVLLFLAFVFFTIYSYSQPNKPIVNEGVFVKVADYAELIVYGSNTSPESFTGFFEYSIDTPPIKSKKCHKKHAKCYYTISVMRFVKEMENKGWTIVSSSTGDGDNGAFYQYLFRKE